MADVKRTIHVRVLTFDPAQSKMIGVPNATLLVEDDGFLWDPNLSSGSPTTDAEGKAQVEITFDEKKENTLNPYFTIKIPSANRTVPSGVSAAQQFTLPEKWVTRHYVNRRIPRIGDHTDPNKPLEIFVGLDGHLRIAYADFDPSQKRNLFALPEDTIRLHLADVDFLLNPDDTLTGFGFDPKKKATLRVGEHEEYPYFDVWPTAPCALDAGSPPAPRAWLDPPYAPVGSLGGGSFEKAGPMAVDVHGFVFMIDGQVVRRFYPDGTLCETIEMPYSGFNNPGGLAVDQYRHLFVADTGKNEIAIFRLDWDDLGSGTYKLVPLPFKSSPSGGSLNGPTGLAVVPNPAVDGEEFLAVADSGNRQVQVFRIQFPIATSLRHPFRTTAFLSAKLTHLTTFGPVGAHFQNPVGVAADRQRRLFVCDSALHRVSRWVLNPAATGYTHEVDWEKTGGGSGNGNREFDTPVSLAVDSKNGYVYVAESGNRRVQRLDDQLGNHLTHWVHAYAAQPPTTNPFTPTSVVVDARGEVYAADTANHRVVRGTVFEAAGSPHADAAIPRVQGAPWVPRNDPAHMNGPTYVYYAPDGKLWVSDSGNDRVLVFEKNSSSGELVLAEKQLLAAQPPAGLKTPVGVAVDAQGKAFVVDSGNYQIVPYELSLTGWVAGPALGAGQGAADNQFDDPRGIAIARRTEPILYVADMNNNRVQVLKRNGDFLPAQKITTGGGTALKQPEDVAVDSLGNVYVADTGNARIAQFDASHIFVREIKVPAPGPHFSQPCGVSVDDEDKLIVTDRGLKKVFRIEPDGDLLAYWDLEVLLRKSVTPNRDYYPELARLVVFAAPARAVVDSRGLLVVADKGLDRVRLVRTRTDVSVNLFGLGKGLFDSLPDISFRAVAKADYSKDLGLKLEVTDKGIIFEDVNEFKTEPEDDFALDHYDHHQVLGAAGNMGAATNAMVVVRLVQRWLKHLTRIDEEAHRWGAGASKKLYVDLTKERSTEHAWGSNVIKLSEKRPSGRGFDAWDNSVVVHEMAHWIFNNSVHPFPPFAMVGGDHNLDRVSRQNTAILEGHAEYVMLFWGSEVGSTDRVRGFPMAGSSADLTTVNVEKDRSKPRIDEFHVGGPSGAAPTWNAPERCLEIEGYFAQAIWQIHHALAEPGILFADSPGFWYPHNTFLTEAQSQRFSNVLRRALRDFPTTPGHGVLKNGTRMYLRQVLVRARNESVEAAELVQSLFELNNMLMPTITLTVGTSDTTSGTPVGEEIRLHPGETRDIIIQITDEANLPLRGYNLHLGVGTAARYALKAGPGPDIRHGVNAPASAADLYRATNANGIVNVKFTAPALGAAASITDTMRVTYQPDFDTDRTFSPPEKADDLETTLRRLYLYELRSAAKTWSGTGNNLGAMVSRELRFVVTPP